MPASEIDDIFATKGKASTSTLASASTSTSTVEKKKKKKDKKRKRDAEPASIPDDPPVKSKKARVVPETVVDTSAAILSAPATVKPAKKSKTSGKLLKAASAAKSSGSKKSKEVDEEALFKDSRGTGPRRKTEEGFSIFKEAELGIDVEAGDTPLCPFDCQCCF